MADSDDGLGWLTRMVDSDGGDSYGGLVWRTRMADSDVTRMTDSQGGLVWRTRTADSDVTRMAGGLGRRAWIEFRMRYPESLCGCPRGAAIGAPAASGLSVGRRGAGRGTGKCSPARSESQVRRSASSCGAAGRLLSSWRDAAQLQDIKA